MKRNSIILAGLFSAMAFSGAQAQTADALQGLAAPSPQEAAGGAGGNLGFAGYVPSAAPITEEPAQVVTPDGQQVELNNGRRNTQMKVDGFNDAMEQNFPMTPEMLRQYKSVYEEQQRIILERPQPELISDMGVISLEPGEPAPTIYVSPGMFTAISIYDSTGQPWPIVKRIVGDEASFQVVHLGDGANGVTVTPQIPVGWTNMALVLQDEPKPVIVKLEISSSIANTSRDIQITKPGPKAVVNTVSEMPVIRPVQEAETTPIAREAGSPLLMAALSGVDLPDSAKPLAVAGVNAKAWSIGGRVLIRSRNPLVSPAWSNSLAGPDGVFVYEIGAVPNALFSVNGRIVRADIDMP